jgi:hypothetical protein
VLHERKGKSQRGTFSRLSKAELKEMRTMKWNQRSQLSRRDFVKVAGLTATAISIRPHSLFAEAESPVVTIRREAADAKIDVQKLRDNISVLMGSGGNIAVLTGRDGKVLVDAGITASRPRIMEALDSLSADPNI